MIRRTSSAPVWPRAPMTPIERRSTHRRRSRNEEGERRNRLDPARNSIEVRLAFPEDGPGSSLHGAISLIGIEGVESIGGPRSPIKHRVDR